MKFVHKVAQSLDALLSSTGASECSPEGAVLLQGYEDCAAWTAGLQRAEPCNTQSAFPTHALRPREYFFHNKVSRRWTMRALGILNPKFRLLLDRLSLPHSMRACVAGSNCACARRCRLSSGSVFQSVSIGKARGAEYSWCLEVLPAEQSCGAGVPSMHLAHHCCPPISQPPCHSHQERS
jgi:hypothetical protein